jgi:ribose transport system permease protein
MSVSAPEIPAKTTSRFKWDLKTIGPLAALALLVLLGITLNENFLTYNNITNVLARTSFIGIIAIGATFVITAGGSTCPWAHGCRHRPAS